VAVAKQHVGDLLAPDNPHNMRLEEFLYDDHLGVWTLTIGLALPTLDAPRNHKIARVSEAHKTVLSVRDR
jgi:hypothetical protein